MRRNERRIDPNMDRKQLEYLASISTEFEHELYRREREEKEAARQQRIQEFVNAITTPDWRDPPRPMSDEQRQFVDAIMGRRTVTVHEGDWDSSKHPRRGGPPNAGWWASTGTGGAGNHAPGTDSTAARDHRPSGEWPTSTSRSENDEANYRGTVHATPLPYSPSNGAPAHAAAAVSSGGHHWVPQSVYGALENKLTEKAREIFELGTESPGLYYHANDTWNGVTHGQYNDIMRELLEDWIKTCGKKKLKPDDAARFLSWIATGKCDSADFLAKHKKQYAMVFKWRAGFNQSVVVAAEALRRNRNLTGVELKGIAQTFVNGKSSQPLSNRAAKVAAAIVKGGKSGLMAMAKKVLPGLMFLSAATAAQRGWAGEGHTGTNLWGAANEVARDAMAADVIEYLVFSTTLRTIDGLVNLIVPGLNDPTRYRFLWRNGVRIDTKTGQPVE